MTALVHPKGCRCLACNKVPWYLSQQAEEQQGRPMQSVPNVESVSLPAGDRERKALPLLTFLCEYFPDAIIALTELSVVANEQHNPGEPLRWARGKSKDQLNTAFRHLFDRARGVHLDTDGTRHIAKTAWRALAQLQLDIEADRK